MTIDLDLELRLCRDEVREWKHNYEQAVLDGEALARGLSATRKRLALVETAAWQLLATLKEHYPEIIADEEWSKAPALLRDALETK